MNLEEYKKLINRPKKSMGVPVYSSKKRVYVESRLQAACVRWFRYEYQSIKNLLFAIPNGGFRRIREARALASEGVTPGIPDLMLAVPINPYHGLFIEMKAGKNKTTSHQKERIKELQDMGYCCEVVNSFDLFSKKIKKYLQDKNKYEKSIKKHKITRHTNGTASPADQ